MCQFKVMSGSIDGSTSRWDASTDIRNRNPLDAQQIIGIAKSNSTPGSWQSEHY